MDESLVDAMKQMYALRGREAGLALAEYIDPDFRFIPSGTQDSALQREYVGLDGFLDFIEAQAAWTGDTWWPRLDELVIGEHWIIGVVFVTATRARDGRTENFEIIHRWEVRDGRLVGFHSFNDDQRRYDEFHSR